MRTFPCVCRPCIETRQYQALKEGSVLFLRRVLLVYPHRLQEASELVQKWIQEWKPQS